MVPLRNISEGSGVLAVDAAALLEKARKGETCGVALAMREMALTEASTPRRGLFPSMSDTSMTATNQQQQARD